MHVLISRIKTAWRKGKIAAVLFLDIEGAFPNAVLEKLVHNLRKRGIPIKYIEFVKNMLKNWITTLRFDNYSLDLLTIDNRIGQGDLLSMVMYQFYNADLLDILEDTNECALAYVGNMLMLVVADTFKEAHQKLENLMSKSGRVAEWSQMHNSQLEYSKLALIDFAHRTSTQERCAITLPWGELQPVESTKYLGVVLNQQLNWKAQHAYTIEKGMKWVTQIQRIARPSWGVTPKYTRKLYIGVVLPRILYAANIWCTPSHNKHTGSKGKSPAKVMKQFTSIQRSEAIAIMGVL